MTPQSESTLSPPSGAAAPSGRAPVTDPVNLPTGPISVAERRTLDRERRRVLLAGSVGQFIEFYDFTLYGLSALTLSALFFPDVSPAIALLSTFAAFGVAFFVRPLGGLFFGALGDRYGRRPVLYVTLLTIGIATTAIGLLPTYAQIGVLAPILLVICRLLQGFSAGGESVGAPAFVFEHAPKARRGFWLNITLAATALPSVVGGTLILVLSQSMSAASFEAWGWRIPFLIALPLALFGLWIRSHTEESEAFKEVQRTQQAQQKEHTPIRDAFRENWLQMLQVIMVMGLTAMGFYFLSGYFVTYVQTAGDLSREAALLANAAAMLLYALVLPVAGLIGDRFGRKPMLIVGAAAIAVLSVPAFMLVTSGSFPLALIGQFLFVLAVCTYGGGCYTFFVEIFTTRTRFTSAAVSYNVGYAVFGGTAPFIGTWLVGATDFGASPGIYMAVAAAVVFLVLILTNIPETHPLKRVSTTGAIK
ncbi:MFS transporter [Leucobacter luti]|uniref:Putative proline/betaine transporter n=1 Tax=Leucobacter luti TaxID=340320 RepID=A0A4R6RVG4_9MICO|nr:MFS transporter [Leucobacter luti]MCW2289776.1 MHS family proline/betaine transporter-like MFS transporter [Leucobacter luti]QYM77065.1 MFS transporter [Leucobacter luti]TCK34312.1 MHS family proline/betaine transporter-like MFS transporter [Leucobacter luti]TDP90940.1 MHS family proline/betaine transporter-like MFS transporter [Leucobacter luti]